MTLKVVRHCVAIIELLPAPALPATVRDGKGTAGKGV